MHRQSLTSVDKVDFDDVARTLRGVIEVAEPDSDSLLTSSKFWDRCALLPPGFSWNPRWQIFVDGFARCCHWNSWKVYTEPIEEGLSLWHGYAFTYNRWTPHTWCMVRGRIVETTLKYKMYFGAEVHPDECEPFALKYDGYDPLRNGFSHVCTIREWYREVVPYSAKRFSNSIGRERDWATFAVKEGLGR